jgi:hypothetical protein
MGETTMRFVRSSSRRRRGVNIGGGAGWAETVDRLWSAARPANHRSIVSTNLASRVLRFSWVTRRLRVRRLNANWMGSSPS